MRRSPGTLPSDPNGPDPHLTRTLALTRTRTLTVTLALTRPREGAGPKARYTLDPVAYPPHVILHQDAHAPPPRYPPPAPPPRTPPAYPPYRRDAKMQEHAAAWVRRQLHNLPTEQRFQRQLRVFAPADDGERTLTSNL